MGVRLDMVGLLRFTRGQSGISCVGMAERRDHEYTWGDEDTIIGKEMRT